MLVAWLAVFILSLSVLVKFSEYFTDSAEKLGAFLHISPFLVGVTLVSIGTSLPELTSSIFAVLANSSEIVVGNVIGSNISNILLVLGVTAIIGKQVKIGYEFIHVDMPVLIASALLFTISVIDGQFVLTEALLCLVAFFVYIDYTIKTQKRYRDIEIKKEMHGIVKRKLEYKTIIIFIISIIFIYIGAKYTVQSIIHLSEILNIGKEAIAATAVGLGTSLPELTVSIAAIKRGKREIAIGNILGSNIFNTFVVMGASALVGTIIIPATIISFGLPMMIISTFLYFFIAQDKKITSWEGWMLLIFYIFFIGRMFGLI